MPIGEDVYMEITKMIRPVVKSIMYGEPCSTVPVFKKADRKKLEPAFSLKADHTARDK